MATLIVNCRVCQKEVSQEVDLPSPGATDVVNNNLKDGTVCEVCTAEYSRNTDCGYLVNEDGSTATALDRAIRESINYVPMIPYAEAVEKGKKLLGLPQLPDIPVPNLLAKQYEKELSRPPLAEFLNIVKAVGGILPIKRYKSIDLLNPGHVYMGNDGYWYRMGNDGKSEKMGKGWQSK